MKKSYLIILCSTLPLFLFAQGNLTQKLEELWNPDAEQWDFVQVDKWKYDEQNREIYEYHEDSFINDFIDYYLLENHRSKETEYDSQGNLITEVQRNWSDSTWTEYRTNNQYDAQNRIVERLDKYTHSYDTDYTYLGRIRYQYNEVDNKKTEEYSSLYHNEIDWIVNSQLDSTFNENGCLIEKETKGFNNTGTLAYHYKEIYTNNMDCQPLTYESWTQSPTGTLTPNNKIFYTYSSDGKTTTTTTKRFDIATETWNTESETELEIDEKGRSVRQYSEYFNLDYTDKWLNLFTYTDKGELLSRTTYQSYGWLEITDLQLSSRDSFLYKYDDSELLIYKENLYEYHYPESGTFRNKIIIKYNYYCDGQLKSETREQLPNVRRISYEYDKGGDCFLAEKDLEMKVAPNPSDGNISIYSHLLASPDAEVFVYSTLGQEVFRQKIENITDRFLLDLTHLPNGTYVISMIDGETVISEKAFVVK
jgi:hypothetical protein